MKYALAAAALAGSAFAQTSVETLIPPVSIPAAGDKTLIPPTSIPVPYMTPVPPTSIPIETPQGYKTLIPPTSIPIETPQGPKTLIPPTSIPVIDKDPSGFKTLVPPTSIPFNTTSVPLTTLPPPTSIPFPPAQTTVTLEYYDTACGCTKSSTSVGPAPPTNAPYVPTTTTTINGYPCTIAAAPNGNGVVFNGETIVPGAAPTQIGGQPVALVPGTGVQAPSLQVGSAVVPAPTAPAGGAYAPAGNAPAGNAPGSYGGSGTTPVSAPTPLYTGGAAKVAGGLVGVFAAVLAVLMT